MSVQLPWSNAYAIYYSPVNVNLGSNFLQRMPLEKLFTSILCTEPSFSSLFRNSENKIPFLHQKGMEVLKS